MRRINKIWCGEATCIFCPFPFYAFGVSVFFLPLFYSFAVWFFAPFFEHSKAVFVVE